MNIITESLLSTEGVFRLAVGTVLFHGSSEPDFEIEGGAIWVSDSKDVARHFAGKRGEVVQLRLTRDLILPVIKNADDMEEFCDANGVDRSSAEDIRNDMKGAGLPGWIIPDNYSPGHDILIVDPTCLEIA